MIKCFSFSFFVLANHITTAPHSSRLSTTQDKFTLYSSTRTWKNILSLSSGAVMVRDTIPAPAPARSCLHHIPVTSSLGMRMLSLASPPILVTFWGGGGGGGWRNRWEGGEEEVGARSRWRRNVKDNDRIERKNAE